MINIEATCMSLGYSMAKFMGSGRIDFALLLTTNSNWPFSTNFTTDKQNVLKDMLS